MTNDLIRARARIHRGEWDDTDLQIMRRDGDRLEQEMAGMCEIADMIVASRLAPTEFDEMAADREIGEGAGAGIWMIPAIILGAMFWVWAAVYIAPEAIKIIARIIQH